METQRHKLRKTHFAWITFISDIEGMTSENELGLDRDL